MPLPGHPQRGHKRLSETWTLKASFPGKKASRRYPPLAQRFEAQPLCDVERSASDWNFARPGRASIHQRGHRPGQPQQAERADTRDRDQPEQRAGVGPASTMTGEDPAAPRTKAEGTERATMTTVLKASKATQVGPRDGKRMDAD